MKKKKNGTIIKFRYSLVRLPSSQDKLKQINSEPGEGFKKGVFNCSLIT